MPNITLSTLQGLEQRGQKIAMLTCHDATFAQATTRLSMSRVSGIRIRRPAFAIAAGKHAVTFQYIASRMRRQHLIYRWGGTRIAQVLTVEELPRGRAARPCALGWTLRSGSRRSDRRPADRRSPCPRWRR